MGDKPSRRARSQRSTPSLVTVSRALDAGETGAPQAGLLGIVVLALLGWVGCQPVSDPDLSECERDYGYECDNDSDGDGSSYGCGYEPVYPDRCTDCDCDGYTEADGDCDDRRWGVHPGAAEGTNGGGEYCRDDVSDGLDNDCDGEVDEGTTPLTEICNGLDDDCDGEVDEVFDLDDDGWPGSDECPSDVGWFDCDDTEPAIHPGADELCNEIDDDCDGDIDEGCSEE